MYVMLHRYAVCRTRDPKKLEQCDVVVDVGGVYDPDSHRYDHHQRSVYSTQKSVYSSSSSSVVEDSEYSTVCAYVGRTRIRMSVILC